MDLFKHFITQGRREIHTTDLSSERGVQRSDGDVGERGPVTGCDCCVGGGGGGGGHHLYRFKILKKASTKFFNLISSWLSNNSLNSARCEHDPLYRIQGSEASVILTQK